MKYQHLNLLNQIYVPDGLDSRVPLIMCPREEIACPYKLLACTTKNVNWDPIYIHDIPMHRTWITWRKSFHNGRVTTTGFYVCTENPEMFQTIPLDASSTEMYQWLTKWSKTYFVITCPVFVHHTSHGHEMFGVGNTYPTFNMPLLPLMDLSEQLITIQAYTLGTALTLAIALQRTGYWSHHDLYDVLERTFLCEYMSYTQPVPIPYIPFFVDHIVPHICDHAKYYAVMGKHAAHKSLYQLLDTVDDPEFGPSYLEQVVHMQSDIVISTNPVVATFPYHKPGPHTIPILFHSMNDDEDEEEVDITSYDLFGFFQSIVRNKRTWKWWLHNRQQVWSLIFRHQQGTLCEQMQHVFKCLFQLYATGKKQNMAYSRVRALWKDLLSQVHTDDIQKWFHKHVLVCWLIHHLQQRQTDVHMHNIHCPYAFLKDMEQLHRISIHHVYSSNVLTTYGNIVNSVLDQFGIQYETRVNNVFRVELTLSMLLSSFSVNTSYSIWKKQIDKRAAWRLHVLHQAFMVPTIPRLDENEGATIHMIMDDFYRTHPEQLYII